MFALVALVPAGAIQAQERVAVLPIVVHAMDQQAFLQEGLADMLSSRLGQHSGIGVIRVDDETAGTADADQARSAGRAAGGKWVLFGSFTRFGNGASLDLRCLRVDGSDEGDARSIFVQTGSLEQIIPRLANVAERVAAHVNAGPIPDVAAAPVARPSRELQDLRSRVEALERAMAATTERDLSGDVDLTAE
jgi:outer membrane protein insertion porin family